MNLSPPVVPAPHRLCAPSFLPLMASLTLAFGLAAPPAHAGSYTDTSSGGTSPAIITPAADATGPSSASASVSPYSGNGNPTCIIQSNPGTITDTFTWVHGSGQTDATDPPPSCVLVEQDSGATWYVRDEWGTGTGTGTADCGLPGATLTSGTYNAPRPSLSLSATLYSQKSGASFSVSCSPTVSFTGQTGTEGYVSGAVMFSGGAYAYPITITPGGTQLVNGVQEVLTGQQITATLSGIPSNYTVTKYTWSGQSGTCFKTYNEKATSNQLVLLDSTDLTGPAAGSNTVAPLAFYDSAKENLTLTCAITLTAPDGKSTVNLTATAPPINVLKPTVTRWDIHTGYVQYVQNPTTGQKGYQLRTAPGSTQTGGEAWQNATIVVPAPFAATGGLGCFAQLATPNVVITNDDPTKSPVFPNNNQQGLDNSFPYQGDQWDVSGLGAGADSPVLYYENYNSGGYTGWSQVSDTDTFTTWLMYKPPGGVWVPLQSYDWTWSFTSQWSKSQNQWNLFRARPSPTSGDPGYTGAVTSTFPQWSLVQTNT